MNVPSPPYVAFVLGVSQTGREAGGLAEANLSYIARSLKQPKSE